MILRISLLGFILAVFALPSLSQSVTKPLTISVSSPVDVLVTRADGKRFGFDAVHKKDFKEINGAAVTVSPGREPVYRVPVGVSPKPLTIAIFGRAGSNVANLAITAPNSVISIRGMPVTSGATATVRVSPNGNSLDYSSTSATITPKFVFAIDPKDAKQPSYIFEITRESLAVGKTIKITHLSDATYGFGDDSTSLSAYAVKVTRIKADGTEDTYAVDKLTAKRTNHFELDLTKWNGKTGACLRSDDGPGLRLGKCRS